MSFFFRDVNTPNVRSITRLLTRLFIHFSQNTLPPNSKIQPTPSPTVHSSPDFLKLPPLYNKGFPSRKVRLPCSSWFRSVSYGGTTRVSCVSFFWSHRFPLTREVATNKSYQVVPCEPPRGSYTDEEKRSFLRCRRLFSCVRTFPSSTSTRYSHLYFIAFLFTRVKTMVLLCTIEKKE